MSAVFAQLPLGIQLRDSLSLANYFPGENQEVLQQVQSTANGSGERLVVLWGVAGTGKTHLLQAACRVAAERAANTAYIPLRAAAQWPPEMLEGLEQCALICLDDLDALAQQPAWAEAVFHLFNRALQTNARLLAAAACAPAHLKLNLPDLVSRLASGVSLHVKSLSEPDKICALQQRAQQRGFDLPDEVARFLLRRCPRDMDSLFQFLDRLDHASLVAQRKLTIPFVRQLL